MNQKKISCYPTKKLGEVIELHYGKGIPKYDRKADGKYIIYGANGKLGRADKYSAEGEAIIVGRKGSAGEVRRVSGKFWPSDVTYYVLGNEKIDIDYLFHLFKSLNLQRFAVGVKPGINRNRIYEIEIPLPPLEIQRKIVERIEKLMGKIDEANKLRKEAMADASSLIPSALNKIFEGGKKKGWKEKELEDLIETLTPSEKIKKKDFKQKGEYPVIDQSQNEIAGWTDDITSLVNIKKPVVIFGDHTCAVKYCEKQFAQGADGIKILSTNERLLPKFLYLVLKNKPIKTEGYRRHFSKLKKYKIPIPPLSEQQKIVKYLDSLSEKIRKIQALQSATDRELKLLEKSVFKEAFGG